MNRRKEAERYVLSNYGHLILVSEPKYDETGNTWEVELESNYPRVIHDDMSTEKPIVRSIVLKNLGNIAFDNNMKVISATPREAIVDTLESRLKILKQRAERIMVRASADKLVHLVV